MRLSFRAVIDNGQSFGTSSGTITGDGTTVYDFRYSLASTDANSIPTTSASITLADITAPTVSILNAPASHDGVTPFDVTVQFSEPVVNFVAGDVTVGNGTVTSLTTTDNQSFTASITPSSGAAVTVDVAAGVAQDQAGNDNAAATRVTVADAIAPTVSILNAPGTHDGTAPFNVTVQFSEPVVNFVAGDVTVGNGTVTALTTTDNQSFTASITPSSGSDITIDVAAGVAQDQAGNDNTAATRVTVEGTALEQTTAIIGSLLENRGNLLLQNRPSQSRRLDRLNGRDTNNGGISGFGVTVSSGYLPFSATISDTEGRFSFSLRKAQAAGAETSVSADPVTILSYAGIQQTGPRPSQGSYKTPQETTERRDSAGSVSTPPHASGYATQTTDIGQTHAESVRALNELPLNELQGLERGPGVKETNPFDI
ncbi:Ig-like domain-containing protein [Coralliovum pocilloporae]|uniref:Ig-like domain-containing protein n=1 Tax=Coralliovum pocilloporae TaxID=3066369 RepID=UPI0033077025